MKNFLPFLFFILSSSLFAQSQTGISAGLNYTSIKSDDIFVIPGTGYEFGLSSYGGLHKSADLIVEILFATQRIKLEGKEAYSESPSEEVKFNISNLNINALYNQYLIIPEGFKTHIALQTGISFSILNTWETAKDQNATYFYEPLDYRDSDFQDLNKINTYLLFGISGGFEQIRGTLRYNYLLSNLLRPLQINTETGERDIELKQHYISFTITYLFQKFK